MCYGMKCEFYFFDENHENAEYCLNEEKCNKTKKKHKFLNLDEEAETDGQ